MLANADAEGRISKDPAIRREELLAAAFELFGELGYESTSVQTITETVGVSKGLFYHYFQSKSDLLDQAVRWKADQFLATMPAHASEMPGSALDKARGIIGRIVGWKSGEFRDMTMTYVREAYREDNLALRVRMQREHVDRLQPLFVEIIAEGAAEGVFRVDDPQMASMLVWSLWSGASDPMAKLLLGLPGHPENAGELIRHTRAWESGIERLLGVEPGTLALYDHDYLAAAFADVASAGDSAPASEE